MFLESMWMKGVLMLSCFISAGMIPLAVLISRDRLRRYRRSLVIALEDWISKTAKVTPLPSFDAARIKYELSPSTHEWGRRLGERDSNNEVVPHGSMWSFALPTLIYSGLSALGFISAFFLASEVTFWSRPNFILSGMFNISETLKESENLISSELTAYQWNSGAAIAAGFIGAYLFTLQYLVGRVRNYELSPTSFLVASVSILEGTFIVAVARHLTAHSDSYAEFTIIAFLLWYFPTFGITWIIERLRVQNLKQVAPAAYNRRFVLPTDMIDGVDTQTKFRLMEAGVQDVQNLATANPVLLYVETPYSLLTILDWIAQAQLIVAFGGETAADLRQIGVRTTFDVAGMRAHHSTRQMVLKKVWPDSGQDINPSESEHLFVVLEKVMSGDIHVRRLYSFWSVMDRLVEEPDPKSYAPWRDRTRPDKVSDPSNQVSSLEPIFGAAAE
jgi:hypothetical protein